MEAAERVAVVVEAGRRSVGLHLARLVHVHVGLLLRLLRMMMLRGMLLLLHVIDHLGLVGMGRRADRLIRRISARRTRLTTATAAGTARAGRARAARSGLGLDQSREDLLHLVFLVVRLPDVVEIEDVLGDLENLQEPVYWKTARRKKKDSTAWPTNLLHVDVELGEPELAVLLLDDAGDVETGESDQGRRIHETDVGAEAVVDDAPRRLKQVGVVGTEVRDELNERSIGVVEDEAAVLVEATG